MHTLPLFVLPQARFDAQPPTSVLSSISVSPDFGTSKVVADPITGTQKVIESRPAISAHAFGKINTEQQRSG